MLRRYRKLGEILLERGFITREELDKALEIQKEKKSRSEKF
ncbi:MAG: type secretion system protein [Thermotoga sp.]|jgi:type IV pilus assembly protein PilB|nr:type secretion system protein [Thermotoga sp.]